MSMLTLKKKYLSGKISKQDYIREMHDEHKKLFCYKKLLENNDVINIDISKENVIFTMKGGLKLYVDEEDRRFIPIEILNFGAFDPTERRLLFSLAEQSNVVFDIGANIGWYTLNFANANPSVSVHSFEPIPFTFRYLEKHLELNEVNNVFVNNFGLSNEKGEAQFYWGRDETGSSSMENIQERDHANIVNCQLSTIDDYCEENRLSVDFIKCDVEGAELQVFQGASTILKRDKPAVFAEMLRKWSAKFGYHPNEIIDIFTATGYRCFAYESNEFKEFFEITDTTEATNFFFLHTDKHADVINNECI